MNDTITNPAVAKATELGRQHGANAASWVFDGNTPRETYEAFRAGIEDGDPEIMDKLPAPDLSGQWADGYSSRDLANDTGVDTTDPDSDVLFTEVCDAYEVAFSEAAQAEVERMISVQLDD